MHQAYINSLMIEVNSIIHSGNGKSKFFVRNTFLPSSKLVCNTVSN